MPGVAGITTVAIIVAGITAAIVVMAIIEVAAAIIITARTMEIADGRQAIGKVAFGSAVTAFAGKKWRLTHGVKKTSSGTLL